MRRGNCHTFRKVEIDVVCSLYSVCLVHLEFVMRFKGKSCRLHPELDLRKREKFSTLR